MRVKPEKCRPLLRVPWRTHLKTRRPTMLRTSKTEYCARCVAPIKMPIDRIGHKLVLSEEQIIMDEFGICAACFDAAPTPTPTPTPVPTPTPRSRHPIFTLTGKISFARLKEISRESGWYWTLNRRVYSDDYYKVESFKKPKSSARMIFRIPR